MSGQGAVPVAVTVAGVSHRYGATAALRDVSLRVAPGAMLGLIGPDGVGKSTLLGLIAGVRKLQGGAVRTLGADMADAARRSAVCARIAYMPQGLGRNLYPTLSVYENIDFFGRLYGQPAAERRARIADLVRRTGLAPFVDRPAGKLSGGMKQKLSLCCALVHDPDLLILDEPTTGVDPLSRRQFWALIADLRARRPGMTVMTATAYMSEAETFDTLVAMDDGRILATGTAAALKAQTGQDTLERAFLALSRGDAGAAIIKPAPARRGVTGPPAIEATGLTMRFGDFTAVDDVSFRIERGEIFGFLGSNGCGKTTTMKMLTGLLTPTAGAALLFGQPMDSGGMAMRRRVGYMSQAFSLYGELSVRQNIDLHAAIFRIPVHDRAARVAETMARFGLDDVADALPAALSLGVRQRLQLAVAVLHRPDILILDEPTSGVDPAARDLFWDHLITLSRRDGVTIFISTHFMNEAERCDRISLMHAGRVLAVGAPDALRQRRAARTLEAAFIAWLEEAQGDGANPDETPPAPEIAAAAPTPTGFTPRRVWAFARRETQELLRDPIRLAFGLLGPMVLMLAMGFGISFDVENLTYAALDQDRSQESRMFLSQLSSSPYFDQQPELTDLAALDARMQTGEIGLAVIMPPGFGRDLLGGDTPEIAAWLDGANSTRAEIARGYVQGVFASFLSELSLRETGEVASYYPAALATRFRYNQAFRSFFAIPPGVLMMMLIMIPAMMTSLGVVREKEVGSIANVYAAPVSRFEFLLGKQGPYVLVAMISGAMLVALMRVAFGLHIVGDVWALVSGALLYTTAATAFGLVVSTFVRSQIAAIFASSIIVMVPTVNFSGMLYPVSSLDAGAQLIGQAFPPLYFQRISTGVFNKALDFSDLYANHLALAAFCVVFWTAATLLLAKQDR